MEVSEDGQGRDSEPPNIIADYKGYQDRVTAALVAVTKSTGVLAAQDLSFHRSASQQVSRSLDRQNSHLLRLTNKLLKAATQETNLKTPQPRDCDGVEDNWRSIVDVIDDLLEKTDASLDEFTGAIKRLSPSTPDRTQTPQRSVPTNTRPFSSASRSHHIEKPQLLFDRKVDNHETEPFKPLLVSKPHAVVSLDECIGDAASGYDHPYAHEIEQYQYPPALYRETEPIPYIPIDIDSATFVDTEEGVHEMLAELKAAGEIAVDLEHHDYRTYVGIVSLMQISTREKDWIVDTLKPWREKLQILNEVFADPKILKVFHGSASDMIWLQRDLGLYVVGLFDTYYACDALNFPARGLKYLLMEYAGVEAQKQYQMADWRQRPLSPELIDYARSDTHYLLYIYDNLRNELVKGSTPTDNLTNRVLAGSKKEALQVHKRFVYDFDSGRGTGGWYTQYAHQTVNFTPQQFAVFKALHRWRDESARASDESTAYIMPNRALMQTAEAMPKNMTSLYKQRPIPEIFKSKSAPEIFQLIAKAIEQSKDDPPVQEQLRQNEDKYGALPENRWHKKAYTPRINKGSEKSQLTGLAGFLQQARQNGDIIPAEGSPSQPNGTASEVEQIVRSYHSGFWGSVESFMRIPFMEPALALEALDAILPLPDISADSFEVTEEAIAPIEDNSNLVDTPMAGSDTPNQDEVFTLRDSGSRKRKAAEALADDEDVDDYDPFADQSLSNITDADASISTYSKPGQGSAAVNLERAQAKEKKRQRKEERQARREAEREEQNRKARNMVPFDYDAAESMLEPKPTAAVEPNGVDGSGDKSNKGKKKHMNPFAKALDTGTGARRNKLGQEGAGRSMTFKS